MEPGGIHGRHHIRNDFRACQRFMEPGGIHGRHHIRNDFRACQRFMERDAPLATDVPYAASTLDIAGF